MSKDHLLKLLCSVYTQEISADQAFDELEDLIDRIKRLEEAGNKMERWCSDLEATLDWLKAKEPTP